MHEGAGPKDYGAIGRLPHWESLIQTTAELEARRRNPRGTCHRCDDCQSRRRCSGCNGTGTVRFRYAAILCEKCLGTGFLKDFVHAEDLARRTPFSKGAWAGCEGCVFSYYGELDHDRSILAAFGVPLEPLPPDPTVPARHRPGKRHQPARRGEGCYNDVNTGGSQRNGSTRPTSACRSPKDVTGMLTKPSR